MVTSLHVFRCFVALMGIGLVSCDRVDVDDAESPVALGSVAQPLTDTDGDAMDDAWEIAHFGNLSATSAADADSDGMTNGEEHQYGFVPTSNDAFADADGDRYPNVFEVRKGSDPNLQGSVPAATYVVNGSGGGTHTTVGAAVTAANVVNGAYQIIGIAPGVYTGSANLRTGVTIASTKPKLLLIGLQGAAKTVIDGGQTNLGWLIQNAAVVSSLTFRNTKGALEVDSPASEVRFVDLMVRDNSNAATNPTPGLYVNASGTTKVYVVGSTFLDNSHSNTIKQIKIANGAGTLLNTVVWSQTSGTMVGTSGSGTLTTNYCLVKGQTLTGTGNLAGNVNPKLRADGHLLWDSPLRSAGGTMVQSRIDMDGELRQTTPDIGVDQFNDTDSDELADQWELEYTSNLTTLTSRTQESDGDGLSNEGEYASATNPIVSDTDVDGVLDGDEVLLHGSDPLNTDTDRDDMPDGWEVSNGLTPLLVNTFDDSDGDRYPDVFEYRYSTDPSSPASTPTPTYVVNGAGGGTHTTVGAAVTAANVANGAYQIIGIAPGVYTGSANLRSGVTITSTKPKLLLIGLQGAARTIIDGGQTNLGWLIENDAVISSLTFRRTQGALVVDFPAAQVRLVDVMVRDNANAATIPTPGLYVNASDTTKVRVVGSTFLNNRHLLPTQSQAVMQIKIVQGAATLSNTVVWSNTSGTMVGTGNGGTVTANNCLVKGQTLTGTGNLAGNADPKLVPDGHLLRLSPLRGAGAVVAQSRIDMDGEQRPSTAPDIGVDQFQDPDGDGLPDAWEIATFGSASSIIGGADDDSDELSNVEEFDWSADWLDPDTDNDGVLDGVELAVGIDPIVADADELSGDLNHDGLIDSLGAQLGYQPNQLDSDGDSISNADELLLGTDPIRVDSDGDGVPDATDPLPLDHLVSTLPSDPQDLQPPVITLTAPLNAVEQ